MIEAQYAAVRKDPWKGGPHPCFFWTRFGVGFWPWLEWRTGVMIAVPGGEGVPFFDDAVRPVTLKEFYCQLLGHRWIPVHGRFVAYLCARCGRMV